jgi:arylsulfatase A-like enzyme
MRDLYDAEIRQLDDRLADLFAFLERSGLAATTLVAVTSDHGEEFFERGRFLHGMTLHKEQLHVPFLLRGPGVPEGVRIAEPAHGIDVPPTLLALLGVAAPATLDGHDLSAQWRDGASDAPPRMLFAETWPAENAAPLLGTHRVSVLQAPYKLIHNLDDGTTRLYDHATDPGETRNLVSERPQIAERLRAAALRYDAARIESGAAVEVSPAQRERLRALGYAE